MAKTTSRRAFVRTLAASTAALFVQDPGLGLDPVRWWRWLFPSQYRRIKRPPSEAGGTA